MLPNNYRLVNILLSYKDQEEVFTLMTDIPGLIINDMIASSPNTVVMDLLNTNRAYLMEIDPIKECYYGTYKENVNDNKRKEISRPN